MSRGSALILSLRGELDLASVPTLQSALDAAAQRAPEHLILDLGELRFLDCTGLRTLIGAREHFSEDGCRVELRRIPRQIARLLELTGTRALFSLDGLPAGAAR